MRLKTFSLNPLVDEIAMRIVAITDRPGAHVLHLEFNAPSSVTQAKCDSLDV